MIGNGTSKATLGGSCSDSESTTVVDKPATSAGLSERSARCMQTTFQLVIAVSTTPYKTVATLGTCQHDVLHGQISKAPTPQLLDSSGVQFGLNQPG
jgi:hypothetical protein